MELGRLLPPWYLENTSPTYNKSWEIFTYKFIFKLQVHLQITPQLKSQRKAWIMFICSLILVVWIWREELTWLTWLMTEAYDFSSFEVQKDPYVLFTIYQKRYVACV